MTSQACIDGQEFLIQEGETILDAARRNGIEIPTLCHAAGLSIEGGCRICLVELRGEERPRAACHTLLHDGMDVKTSTPRLEQLRREVLELCVSELPPGSLQADPAGNEFERLMARYGLTSGSDGHSPGPIDSSHPYLRFDAARCITCRRCLHACEDVQGQFVYGIEGRGAEVRLSFGPDDVFAHSDCVACGACVESCPTGALSDRDRLDPAVPTAATRSTCGYCGVGCQVRIESAAERVVRISGEPQSVVNRGHLCAKGRYAHGYQRSPDRLERPLLRREGKLVEVGWDEALGWLARRLRKIRDQHGPDALGALSSSRSTNEAAYLLQKLFRSAIGTNNVDCCARVCHSSTALALQSLTGTGAASASYRDIELANCIVVAGANPTEAHPVLGARIKQAARRGARLVVIDPRRIELVEWAAHHLQLRPGTNVMLFNALAKLLIESGRYDREYVDRRTEGLDRLAALAAELTLSEVCEVCEVAEADVRAVAHEIGRGPTLFVHGLGLSELVQGTASVMTLCNLGMLSGSIGRPGAGMLPLRGQNNVQGNADMGSMPDQLTGYQPVAASEVRRRVEQIWGAPLAAGPGLTLPEMLDAARLGQIRALWIQGEDVAQSDPDQTHVIAALERLELLVVQELFPSETTSHAHLVLPAAGALEQDGSFTNGERRIQRVRAALRPPGQARPDWEVIRDVGVRLGQAWRYSTPSEVMDEIARVAPALYGGVSYARLEQLDGLQWPCPGPEHPGTASVHVDGFLRGRGKLTAIAFQPGPEHDVAGYPYTLITGRVLQHYNVGTMTRRTPSRELTPADLLEIHPDDALRESLPDGGEVRVESRWGACRVRLQHSRRMARGTLFLSFHFPETHANRLTGPHLDPDSKCPDYKVTAVRLV